MTHRVEHLSEFFGGRVVLHAGDCLDVIKTFADNSIDSIATDPPYALVSIVKRFGKTSQADDTQTSDRSRKGSDGYARLAKGFMGKEWDNGSVAFAVEFWEQVLRVLKPGGHVAAFGGTRSYHRLACAIEDAGFEIRDTLFYLYGSGFPKSHSVGKKLDATLQRCSCDSDLSGMRAGVDAFDSLSSDQKQDVLARMQGSADWAEGKGPTITAEPTRDDSMRPLRERQNASASVDEAFEENLLQPKLPGERTREPSDTICGERPGEKMPGEGAERSTQSGMEGRNDLSQGARQLREREIRSMPAGTGDDGASGRLHNGASTSDGALDRAAVDADGMRSPQGPSASEQPARKSRTLAGQSKPQECGAWDHCDRCGKPIVPDGLGTALKPAVEPICLARKPLSESSVAANILRWGTGALNIDGCRVGDEERSAAFTSFAPCHGNALGAAGTQEARRGTQGAPRTYVGRWPANIVHDGSPEVVAMFPDSESSRSEVTSKPGDIYGGGAGLPSHTGVYGFNDSGSAARFFYSAKADADDRLGSKHPTVKPVDLMQWLCRLITPPAGTILDPFSGTGTTGAAAYREGFRAVLIERESEYQADIARRMRLELCGPDERSRESIKARGTTSDAGPLFAELSA